MANDGHEDPSVNSGSLPNEYGVGTPLAGVLESVDLERRHCSEALHDCDFLSRVDPRLSCSLGSSSRFWCEGGVCNHSCSCGSE